MIEKEIAKLEKKKASLEPQIKSAQERMMKPSYQERTLPEVKQQHQEKVSENCAFE